MNRIEKLKEMLAQQGTDPFLKHALALEYLKIGEPGTAREYLETLLEETPSYTGSYYHLAKIFENSGDRVNALKWYEQGMTQARQQNDTHTYNELKAAWEELMY